MLVQLRAVKLCQRKIIRREMARHPVEDHVQPGGVRGINEIAEVVAGAEAAGRRIQPGGLIAPAAVERVLVDRQQLQVGKAHPFGVWHQLVGKLPVAEPEVVIGVATPGAEMDFINGDRRIKAVSLLTILRLDNLLRQAANQRCGIRTHLRFEGIRVGFNAQLAVGVNHLEFIKLPVVRPGDKQLPDAGFPTQAHRVAAAIPVVELADNGDTLGIGRPHGEPRAGNAVHGIGMGAQRFIRTQMGPLGEQPGIHLFKQRAKAVGIVNQVLLAVPENGELIAKRVFTTGHHAREEATGIEAFKVTDFAAGFGFNHPDFCGIRQQGTNFQTCLSTVHPKHRKGVSEMTRNKRINHVSIHTIGHGIHPVFMSSFLSAPGRLLM